VGGESVKRKAHRQWNTSWGKSIKASLVKEREKEGGEATQAMKQ
jgi:hypothetical protein